MSLSLSLLLSSETSFSIVGGRLLSLLISSKSSSMSCVLSFTSCTYRATAGNGAALRPSFEGGLSLDGDGMGDEVLADELNDICGELLLLTLVLVLSEFVELD